MRARPFKLLTTLPLLVLAAACVTVRAMPMGPVVHYPPVPRDEVRVFMDEGEIEGPYQRMALLFVEADTEWNNERQMVDAARKKAGQIGANAIVLGEFREPRFSTRVAAAVLDIPTQRKTQILAVRLGVEGEEP
jgi:hypothetical protein